MKFTRSLNRFIKKTVLKDCHVLDAYTMQSLLGKKTSSTSSEKVIKKGEIPFLVGEDRKRYGVPVKCMSSQCFKKFLEEYQESIFEDSMDGPLTLPCSAEEFEAILRLAKETTKHRHSFKAIKPVEAKLHTRLSVSYH